MLIFGISTYRIPEINFWDFHRLRDQIQDIDFGISTFNYRGNGFGIFVGNLWIEYSS